MNRDATGIPRFIGDGLFYNFLTPSKILKDKTLKGKFQELRVYPFIIG